LNFPRKAIFTLTTAIENIPGTAGNDTFRGVIDGATSTYQLGDQVDGKGGTDIFEISIATNPAGAAKADVVNVENFFIRDLAGSDFNAATITGAEQFWTNSSTNNLTVSNIQNNTALGVQNTASNLTATYKDGTFAAGSTFTIAANVAGNQTTKAPSVVTAGHVVTAGAGTDLTMNVLAVGGTNYIQFADGGNKLGTFKTLDIDGKGSVTLTAAGAEFNMLETVDATGNTGGVNVNLGANNKDVTVTCGSGNDRFVIPNFNGTDKVDGGAGKDTLSITLANAIAFAKAAPVTNVEVLEVTGATGAATTLNMDYFGVSNVTIDGAIGHAFTVTNLANNGTVQVNADSTAAVDLTLDVKGAIAGPDDVLTITTDKTGADLKTSAVTIKAGGVETINFVTSSETGAGALLVGGLTDAQIKTINVSGKGNFELVGATVGAIELIDASAAEGTVTISGAGSTSAVTFKGGAGVDTYVASAKGDTIYGSKGADIVTLGAGADILVYTAANQSSAAAKDVIGAFATTADLIQFDASLETGTATYIGAAAFTSGCNTELRFDAGTPNDLLVDFDGNGTVDFVVTLTGVTAATFGAANFDFA
jgi:hypothetical protein